MHEQKRGVTNNHGRYKSLVAALVAIFCFSLAAVVALAVFKVENSTPVIATILASAAPTTAALLALLRSEQNAQKLDDLGPIIQAAVMEALKERRKVDRLQ